MTVLLLWQLPDNGDQKIFGTQTCHPSYTSNYLFDKCASFTNNWLICIGRLVTVVQRGCVAEEECEDGRSSSGSSLLRHLVIELWDPLQPGPLCSWPLLDLQCFQGWGHTGCFHTTFFVSCNRYVQHPQKAWWDIQPGSQTNYQKTRTPFLIGIS